MRMVWHLTTDKTTKMRAKKAFTAAPSKSHCQVFLSVPAGKAKVVSFIIFLKFCSRASRASREYVRLHIQSP